MLFAPCCTIIHALASHHVNLVVAQVVGVAVAVVGESQYAAVGRVNDCRDAVILRVHVTGSPRMALSLEYAHLTVGIALGSEVEHCSLLVVGSLVGIGVTDACEAGVNGSQLSGIALHVGGNPVVKGGACINAGSFDTDCYFAFGSGGCAKQCGSGT